MVLILCASLTLSLGYQFTPGLLHIEERTLSCDECAMPASTKAGNSEDPRLREIGFRIATVDAEIQRRHRGWKTGPLAMGVGGACLTFGGPGIVFLAIAPAFFGGTPSTDLVSLAFLSIALGPLAIIGAVVWAVIASAQATQDVRELRRQRMSLEEEREQIRRQGDLPPPPIIFVDAPDS